MGEEWCLKHGLLPLERAIQLAKKVTKASAKSDRKNSSQSESAKGRGTPSKSNGNPKATTSKNMSVKKEIKKQAPKKEVKKEVKKVVKQVVKKEVKQEEKGKATEGLKRDDVIKRLREEMMSSQSIQNGKAIEDDDDDIPLAHMKK